MNQKASVIEQRQKLACVIAIQGEREHDLLSETQRIRRDIHDLEAQDQGLSLPVDAPKSAIIAAQRGRDARFAKIAELKIELQRKQAELDKVSLSVLEAHQTLGKIEGTINAERRVKISAAIESAAQQAPSREAFRAARAKAGNLRERLEAAESELHVLETAPSSDPQNVEARARELLETDLMPRSGPVVDGSVRRKELEGQLRTLTQAIRLQEHRISQAGQQFARELAAGLRPAIEDIVARIATGVEAARAATQENIWLQAAVAVMTGGESLPGCNYPGIQAPTDTPDAFTFWLDRMRRAGFEV
jgi:hypothetical protein